MSKTSPPRTAATAPQARNAGDTRARILAAARARFSRDAYENVGTRDIAADAGVDAALVNRYFGTKDKLFAEAIAGAFRFEDHLPTTLATFGADIVRAVMTEDDAQAQGALDALGLLLRACGSPATVALVSQRFHAEFVRPLAAMLEGEDALVRAALIAAQVIGLATMKHALASPAFGPDALRVAVASTGAAIQACVAGAHGRGATGVAGTPVR